LEHPLSAGGDIGDSSGRQPPLAIRLAAGLSILEMFILRSLHLLTADIVKIVVLGHVMHYRYDFSSVMVDSILRHGWGGLQQLDW